LPRLGYVAAMSKGLIATVAGLLFVLIYVVVVITLPDLVPRLHWSLEALYWLIAGIVWVFPVRWLMYWAAGKR
jgi:preprotein translocase subunit SecD